MDPSLLKRKDGDKLCFTIDEQFALPFGTPENVRAEVLARIEAVGAAGVETRLDARATLR